MITSDTVDYTILGNLLEAAVAMFAVKSKAREGFFNTSLANLLPILTEILPRFFKKSPKPSLSITLLITTIDFILLHNAHLPTNNLLSLPVFLKVISPSMLMVEQGCLPPTH